MENRSVPTIRAFNLTIQLRKVDIKELEALKKLKCSANKGSPSLSSSPSIVLHFTAFWKHEGKNENNPTCALSDQFQKRLQLKFIHHFRKVPSPLKSEITKVEQIKFPPSPRPEISWEALSKWGEAEKSKISPAAKKTRKFLICPFRRGEGVQPYFKSFVTMLTFRFPLTEGPKK